MNLCFTMMFFGGKNIKSHTFVLTILECKGIGFVTAKQIIRRPI